MAEPVSSSASPVTADAPQSPPCESDLGWHYIWAAIGLLAVLTAGLCGMLRPGAGVLLPVLALLVCLLAAGFDAATSRIPNALTYTAILIGLVLNALSAVGGSAVAGWLGSPGFSQAALGFGACAGIGLVCLALAGMGGGDVKLLVAIGAMLGLSQAMDVFLWTLALAVPYAIINLLIRGKLNSVLAAAALQFLQIVCFHRSDPAAAPSRSTIPLAVPLALAMFCTRLVPQEVVSRWLSGT